MGSIKMETQMDNQLLHALQIWYINFIIKVSFTDDSNLTIHKSSAIYDGIDEMLLRANCIRDRKCGSCNFKSECIVRRTMYSNFEINPDYITSGDSIGYVLKCEEHQTYFSKGSTLSFCLILFGKTIVYFNQYLQALYMLEIKSLWKTIRFRPPAIM